MHKKLLKSLAAAMLLLTSANAFALVDSYEVTEMGYLRTPMETANGIILTNSEYSEIYALDGDKLTPILQERNCGLYTNLSPDGKYLGFKSFNDADEQAPAILDVATGIVTVLENYTWECGQVSFANDGTMAYTMGNRLIVRKGNTRKAFDLGFYTNIANISPDGTQVAYSNLDGKMFVINVTSGAKESLPVTYGYRPIWSPDGSKIAIEIIDGTFAVQERASKKVYNLGYGEAISWANNSDELIFTKKDFVYDFQIESSSIQKVKFDGTEQLTLVKSSDNLPSDAIITRDNKLYVPYKTGAKRGLVVKNLVEGITPSAVSVKEEAVLNFDNETIIGLRHSNPNDNPNIKPSPVPAEGTIGALDIPYLSQIYDSPAVNGCYAHGHVTCAPTSACMFLGYYDLLPQKTTTRRSGGSMGTCTQVYAHAISAVFTNKAGTKTFSETAYGNGCYSVPGGYGYMWTGSRQPSGGYMNTFLTLNGATSSSFVSSWATFSSQAAAGYPYPFCASFGGGGHVVCGFRTNCTYTTSGGFVSRTGSFVCHDPYGDKNDSYWGDDDGQHSSYDWAGYNSGRANIGTFYWGVKATATKAAPVEKKITSNTSEIVLKGVYGSSEVVTQDVKITATGLAANMSFNSLTSAITIEALSDWNTLTGGTLRCTLNTNFSQGKGQFIAYIAIQSGNDANGNKVRLEIPTEVILTNEDGSLPSTEEPTAPEDTENPGTSEEPSYTLDDQNIKLTEGWNFSTNGTQPSYIDLTSNVVRAAAYQDGKLYILQNKAWATPVVTIVDAYTGEQKGTLDMTGIGSATIQLSDILAVDGKIIGCGCVTAAQTLKIYQWASDTAAPTVLLEQVTGKIMGGSMSISGNLTNGRLWFTNDGTSEAYYYTVSNGAVNSTLNTISLMKANGTDAFAGGDGRGSAEVILNSDGSLWIDAKDAVPALFTVSGTTATLSKSMASVVNKFGTALKFFTFGDRKLAAAATYTGTSALTGGQLALLDVAAGVGSETALETRPAAGLGSTANDQRVSTVCVATDRNDGMSLDIWVAVNKQGVAYYYYDGKKEGSSSIEEIFTEEENVAPVEYYNLQGMKVANPQGGIFIKVQGNKVSKEYIR